MQWYREKDKVPSRRYGCWGSHWLHIYMCAVLTFHSLHLRHRQWEVCLCLFLLCIYVCAFCIKNEGERAGSPALSAYHLGKKRERGQLEQWDLECGKEGMETAFGTHGIKERKKKGWYEWMCKLKEMKKWEKRADQLMTEAARYGKWGTDRGF